MSVTESNKIDAIGLDKETGWVVLTISDHLDWSDEYQHLMALQGKLNAYINSIENGDLLDAYPDARGRLVTIEVVYRFDLPPIGEDFLEQARRTLKAAGAELRIRRLS